MNIFKRTLSGLLGIFVTQAGWAADNVVLSAAASLKPAFTVLVKQFEAENPGSTVTPNFASSSQLASQITQGAKVDVFASADRKTMDLLVNGGQVKNPTAFAHSKLTVVFAKAAKIAQPSLEELAKPNLRLVMPSPRIPAAAYIAEFMKKADAAGLAQGQFSARLRANTVSQEPDARMVVAKVVMGEADAAIVYATDLTADIRPKVNEVPIPAALNVQAQYVIGLVQRLNEVADASKFIDYVRSSKGRAVLQSFGFSTD